MNCDGDESSSPVQNSCQWIANSSRVMKPSPSRSSLWKMSLVSASGPFQPVTTWRYSSSLILPSLFSSIVSRWRLPCR